MDDIKYYLDIINKTVIDIKNKLSKAESQSQKISQYSYYTAIKYYNNELEYKLMKTDENISNVKINSNKYIIIYYPKTYGYYSTKNIFNSNLTKSKSILKKEINQDKSKIDQHNHLNPEKILYEKKMDKLEIVRLKNEINSFKYSIRIMILQSLNYEKNKNDFLSIDDKKYDNLNMKNDSNTIDIDENCIKEMKYTIKAEKNSNKNEGSIKLMNYFKSLETNDSIIYKENQSLLKDIQNLSKKIDKIYIERDLFKDMYQNAQNKCTLMNDQLKLCTETKDKVKVPFIDSQVESKPKLVLDRDIEKKLVKKEEKVDINELMQIYNEKGSKSYSIKKQNIKLVQDSLNLNNGDLIIKKARKRKGPSREKTLDYYARYREQNKEKIKENYRKCIEKNKIRYDEVKRKYREQNKEKIKERTRDYKLKNREKFNEYKRKYLIQNKDKIRENYRKNQEKIRFDRKLNYEKIQKKIE